MPPILAPKTSSSHLFIVRQLNSTAEYGMKVNQALTFCYWSHNLFTIIPVQATNLENGAHTQYSSAYEAPQFDITKIRQRHLRHVHVFELFIKLRSGLDSYSGLNVIVHAQEVFPNDMVGVSSRSDSESSPRDSNINIYTPLTSQSLVSREADECATIPH